MKPFHRFLLVIEVIVCFLPAVLLLGTGIFLLCFELNFWQQDPQQWRGVAVILAMVLAGFAGLATFLFVLAQVLRREGHIRRPWAVTMGVVVGAAPLVPYAWTGSVGFALIALLPLACTVHVLYLARHLLLSSPQRRLHRGFAMVAAVLAFVAAAYGAKSTIEETEAEYPPPRKVVLSQAERTSLDALVHSIARSSRDSYDSGDWSTFAALYPAGTFQCWNASGEDHRFGFLSRPGIPDGVQYDLIYRDDYMDGGAVWDPQHPPGTHALIIKYEKSAFVGCHLPQQRLWPQEHFYLRQLKGGFELAHPCPSRESIETKSIVKVWPLKTRKEARAIASSMTEAEQEQLRQAVARDGFPLQAINRIAASYRIPENQATEVLNMVCELAR